MDDFDNLPFSATPMNAFNAGVNSYDHPSIASAKLMTQQLQQQNAQWQSYSDAQGTSTLAGGTYAAGGAPGGRSGPPRSSIAQTLTSIRQFNITSAYSLAGRIHYERTRLAYKRQMATESMRKVCRVSAIVFAIMLVLVVFGIKMPFVSYRYAVAEYWTSRLLLIAALIVLVKTASAIGKAVTAEERRLRVLAQCVVDAFKKSYKDRVKGGSNNGDIPRKALTAKFLYHLNQRIVRKTGAAMEYTVCRFRLAETGDETFFISLPGQVSERDAALVESVSLEDLERLAKQGV